MSEDGASRSSLRPRNFCSTARAVAEQILLDARASCRFRVCPPVARMLDRSPEMRRDRATRQAISKRKEIARRLISLEVMRLSRQGLTADYMNSLSGSLPPVHAPSMTVSGAWIVIAVGPFARRASRAA
jgi:hypothetical protein